MLLRSVLCDVLIAVAIYRAVASTENVEKLAVRDGKGQGSWRTVLVELQYLDRTLHKWHLYRINIC